MKRHSGLFEKMVSIENIAFAHAAARRGKQHYFEVRKVDANPGFYFKKIQWLLLSGNYRTSKYISMTRKCSDKIRTIHKLPYFPDRIVHHCIVQVVEAIWQRSLIRDTYACVPRRGIHDGMRRVVLALKDVPGTQHCLKMDVRQFYPSINHEILKQIVRLRIKDRKLLEVVDEIVDSTPSGVPIGNYLSQHFGNLYLSGYDHWMKEHHGCRYYFRYCDDVVVLGWDKRRLHELQKYTYKYWMDQLNLEMKGNWQVFPVDARGVDFLGYKFFHGYTLLRKGIATRYKRRMAAIRSGRPIPPRIIVSSVASYEGWMVHANCQNLRIHQHDAIVDAHISTAQQQLKEAA
jgi:RNA-directed DNA polymerase